MRSNKKLKREPGEFFTPIARSYGLGTRFVFEHMVGRLVDNDPLKVVAQEIFREGIDGRPLNEDAAFQLLSDALAYVRTDLSQQQIQRLVTRTLAAVLRPSQETVQRVIAPTARDAERATRKATVRAGRRFRTR